MRGEESGKRIRHGPGNGLECHIKENSMYPEWMGWYSFTLETAITILCNITELCMIHIENRYWWKQNIMDIWSHTDVFKSGFYSLYNLEKVFETAESQFPHL